jgi:hypothetical protein
MAPLAARTWVTWHALDISGASSKFSLHIPSRPCYSFSRNDVHHRQANYVQVVHVDYLDYD